MTKKEFENLINSFNRQPGEFAEDEIYEIGLAHKELLHADKSWQNLVDVLGLDKSSEALRSWIRNQQLRRDELPSNPAVITNKVIEEVTSEDVEGVLEEKMKDLFIQQVKTRDTVNSYRRLMREEARIETFKEGLIEAVSTLKTLPKVTTPPLSRRVNKNKREAILMFSDMHLGVNCNNFYNTYNADVAVKRVSHLVDRTIKYCNDNKVDRLTVLNMGDMIQGIIHTSARLEANLDVTEQIIKASEIIAQALNELQASAPEIIYRSVVDNHSRAMANKREHIEKENFNKIIDWYLQERLKDSKIKFVFDNLDDGMGAFELFNGKTVMFAHGHQDTLKSAFQNFIGATSEFVHYILLSHYHSEKMTAYQGVKVFINGSIVGTEEYALSKRLFNKPAQKLLIFEDSDVLDINIDLDV